MTDRRTLQFQAVFTTGAMFAGWLAMTGGALVSAAGAPQGPSQGAPSGRSAAPSASRSTGQPQVMPLLRFEWWNDPDTKRELGLTEDKAKHIDDIYQQRSKALRPLADNLDRQGKELERMTSERTAEDGAYLVQVVTFESARSELNKSRLMMLYRMYRELTPEQYKKFQDISKRYMDQGRGRSLGPGR